MLYVFEEINWRRCRHNTVPLSHIRSTVSDGVSPSPKGGGAEPARPPSKSATWLSAPGNRQPIPRYRLPAVRHDWRAKALQSWKMQRLTAHTEFCAISGMIFLLNVLITYFLSYFLCVCVCVCVWSDARLVMRAFVRCRISLDESRLTAPATPFDRLTPVIPQRHAYSALCRYRFRTLYIIY